MAHSPLQPAERCILWLGPGDALRPAYSLDSRDYPDTDAYAAAVDAVWDLLNDNWIAGEIEFTGIELDAPRSQVPPVGSPASASARRELTMRPAEPYTPAEQCLVVVHDESTHDEFSLDSRDYPDWAAYAEAVAVAWDAVEDAHSPADFRFTPVGLDAPRHPAPPYLAPPDTAEGPRGE